MPETGEDQKTFSSVSDFYNGKSIFITGASGYLGAILLEILLRCLPGIDNIYILLRAKKGVDPHSRKNTIFKKLIFYDLLEKNASITEKVHVIPGDISQPNLGMSEEDIREVAQKASIIFHLAASISFFKKLSHIAVQNCLGTKYVIEFGKKFSKLEALIYTSTAYSNCNQYPAAIKESIYKLPFEATHFIEKLENGEIEECEKLELACTPKWPNNYTFSKSLAENILNEMASDVPVAIVRPSIIAAVWKGTRPGYVEEGSGLVDLSIAVGKGFARVIHCDPNTRFDLIPADVVANTHIVTAWSVATRRPPSPLVINCTGGHEMELSFEKYCMTLLNMNQKYMLPNTFQEPKLILIKNKYLYSILVFYQHYLPTYFIDAILYFKGKKFRLLPLYRFFEEVMSQLHFFTSTTIDFVTDNYMSLRKQLNAKDKELFYIDLENLSFQYLVDHIPLASPFYDWNTDKKSQGRRRKIVLRRTMAVTFFKRFSLMLLCYLLYKIFCNINLF